MDDVRIARKVEFAPHNPPSSGQGPKPVRTVISEGIDHNEYYYEFKEFAEILEGGAQTCTYEEFISPVFIMNAIMRSLESGKAEELPQIKV